MRTWFARAALAASITLSLIVAACGSPAQPAVSSTGQAADASGRAQLEAMVRCLRTHGIPDFPDPVYDPSDGRWHYADYRPAIPASAQQACVRLDPSAVNASPPVPQPQFQALLRLAQCIRQHGLPSWPDPTPQGQFRLPPALLNTKSNPVDVSAIHACQRYIPSGGMNVGAA
jgi:hypothetical protein